MANKLRYRDPAPLKAAIPDVLTAAESFMEEHRDAWDRPLRESIALHKERLGEWEQPTLAGEHTKKRLTDLADDLLTTGQRPMLRVLAVLLPDPDAPPAAPASPSAAPAAL